MRNILAFVVIAMVFAGCGKIENPIDAGNSSAGDAVFGETYMVNTTLAKNVGGVLLADSGRQCHDSLRNVRLLDSLKAYLSLTEAQFAQVQVFGTTLFNRLKEIRLLVEHQTITRDSAKTLVGEARDGFLASVRAIVTAEQLPLFETWITLYWNRHHGHGNGGGHGGRGGHHGGRH